MRIIKTEKINADALADFNGCADEKDVKRRLRKQLLKAFDIYKTAVSYGTVEESAETKNSILIWYNALLDLDENSIKNVPAQVAKFL